MYTLSILIPARSEEWLAATVQNILENIEADTEILVGLDGTWAQPGIPDDKRVKIVYSPEALGQRGMTNYLARLSKAKYVAKTDAHCAFDKGFDRKLIEALEGHDDWTIVPAMKNLHAFNWVCEHCGMEYYQGEKPELCRDETCHFEEQKFVKKQIFEARTKLNSGRDGPTSVGYRFTPDKLQFKYFNSLKNNNDEIAETMSLQGSFFMLTRKKYWELNICDESWGGWGQQGTEVALKTWLSGGRVVIHKGTWYAHMFRTNNQLSFPWNKGLKESQGSQQQRARKACADLFKSNAWDKQVRPLSWLVERFWEPLQQEGYKPDEDDRPWTQADLDKLKLSEQKFSLAPGELSSLASEVNTDSTSTKSVLVGDGKKVVPLTVGLSGVVPPTTSEDVLGLGDELKMVRVATGGVLTDNVVNDSVVDKGLNEPSVDDTMNERGGMGKILDGDSTIPILVSESTPNPTPTTTDSNITEQNTDSTRLKPSTKRFRLDGHNKIISYGALYFTDNQLPEKLANWCREKLILAIGDMPLACVSLQPMDFGNIRIVLPLERSYLTMFTQILAGLEALDTDVIFMAEHDCGYPPEHFDFTPPDKKFYYDTNWWKTHDDGIALKWTAEQVSGLCAYRDELIKYYRYRIETFDKENFDRKFEPFSGEGSEQWEASIPHIDIRHSANLTYNKRGLHHFRNKDTAINFTESKIESIPGWNLTTEEIYGIPERA